MTSADSPNNAAPAPRPHRDRRINPCHLRRDESHREQHGQAPSIEPLAPHPLASNHPPVLVQTQAQVADLIAHLRQTGSFAFDSEFIGERTYEPQLCLVQVATTRQVFLADPLAGANLMPLWELIVDPRIEKVVLAGQQDVGPAVAATGRAPANIMDVQIAAGFVHPEFPLSLSRLIEQFAGVPLSKGLAFSQWDRRPLSASQIRYAGDDVRYLPAARVALGEQLTHTGRDGWARAECAAMLEELATYRPEPRTLYLRVRGRDRLEPRQLAVLRELAIVRDEAARRENLPARTLLTDGVLTTLSRRPARRLSDLDAIKGLPRPVETRYGPQIVEATARALALPREHWPAAEAVDQIAPRERVDRTWNAVDTLCMQSGVATPMVTSRRDIARLCSLAALGRQREHRLLAGWRSQLLGAMLDEVLSC